MSKNQQAGRSMVEMLGVLAIIGVLSVGGVYGYSVAMRSYRINEIVHAISLLYPIGRAQDNGRGISQLNYTPTFPELPKGVDFIVYENHTISVKTTDPEDCPPLVSKIGNTASIFATSCSANGTTTIIYGDATDNEDPDAGGGGGGGAGAEVSEGSACHTPRQKKCSNFKYYYCDPITDQWIKTGETC